MTDPAPPTEINDLTVLKALAHPRRQLILRYLGLHGPANSTTLAAALGLNTGATSYHLRELAKHGLVDEVPERAQGRERWWRAPIRDLRVPPRSRQSDEVRPVVDEMTRREIADDFDQLLRFQDRRDEMPGWSDLLLHARGSIQVTPDELMALFEDVIALTKRYKRTDAETLPGAATVLTRFFAFPEMPAGTPEPELDELLDDVPDRDDAPEGA